MGFTRWGEVDDAKLNVCVWRKTTAVTAVASQWYDDSQLAGYPPAQFYASEPLVAATLAANKGIRHWTQGHGASEHLLSVSVWGNAGTLEAPAQYVIGDWLLYYPFVDGDSTDLQEFDNTVTLPRYTDGVGVRAFIVAQGPGVATGTYTLSYTNQDGTAGRTSSGTVVLPTAAGFVLTTGGGATNRIGPFVGLQGTDTGIRSVESFAWTVAPGGIAAIVLVKPLASFLYAEIGTYAETTWWPRMPEVADGACLHLLRHQTGATPAARTFGGMLTTIRS